MVIDDDNSNPSTGPPASESQCELEPSEVQAFAFWVGGSTAYLQKSGNQVLQPKAGSQLTSPSE